MNPCPQCGAPLRWIPEGNFWNCDRCGNRVAPNAAPPQTPQPQAQPPTPPPGTYPPPMHGGPPQGYPPQGYGPQGYPPPGYGHYPQHGPPKGKGKLIALIAGSCALAAGGIVLAIVLSKKGSDSGGGGGGFDSAEALAKATTEALAAGDGDKLVSFAPPVDTAMAVLDCPPEAKASNEQQAKQDFEETKKRFAEAAGKMKGSGLTFKSAHTDGIAKTEIKAGEAAGPCKAKVTVTITGVGVELDYTSPTDKSKQEHKTTYGMMIVDGHYYLVHPGEVPEPLRSGETTPETPTPTPTGSGDLAAVTSELDAIRAEACACKDAACADAQLAKLQAFADKYKDMQGAKSDARIQGIAEELTRCITTAKTAGTTPTVPTQPTQPTPPTEPGKGLPECEAYAKAAERFIKCTKVPKQSRDAVQTAVDTMRKNWGDPATMSPDMKKSAAETCVTLEKSMKDAAKAIGCK
jgi:hypothetical protein